MSSSSNHSSSSLLLIAILYLIPLSERKEALSSPIKPAFNAWTPLFIDFQPTPTRIRLLPFYQFAAFAQLHCAAMSGVPSSSASRRASNTGSARRVEVDSEESETENGTGTGTPQRQTTTNGRGRQTSDGVEVTPRRTPLKSANSQTQSKSKSQKSGASRRTTIVEENDENDVAQSSNGADTPTASMKKRRLSKSGRASVIPEPETAASTAGSDGEDDEATPPPPSTMHAKSDRRTSKIPSSGRRVEVEDDEDAEPALNGSDNEAEEQKAVKKQAKLIRDHKDGYVQDNAIVISEADVPCLAM